jgi:hypothetical protein
LDWVDETTGFFAADLTGALADAGRADLAGADFSVRALACALFF